MGVDALTQLIRTLGGTVGISVGQAIYSGVRSDKHSMFSVPAYASVFNHRLRARKLPKYQVSTLTPRRVH